VRHELARQLQLLRRRLLVALLPRLEHLRHHRDHPGRRLGGRREANLLRLDLRLGLAHEQRIRYNLRLELLHLREHGVRADSGDAQLQRHVEQLAEPHQPQLDEAPHPHL